MIENDILIDEDPLDLLKILFSKEPIDTNNYKINYFGEKSDKYFEYLNSFYEKNNNDLDPRKNLKNPLDDRNYIIYIKYKDIYIGGLSIFDFKTREGFGLNKYLNEKVQSFYIGQWEKNKKCGIGFLKIDESHLYFGKFKDNQINENGFYLNKNNQNLFYGLFNNGEFNQGIYNNLNKNIFYIGKFNNSKKNDDFSIYVNNARNRIFIGQIENDNFIIGYIVILKVEETKNSIITKIKNIFYKNREKYSKVNIKQNKYLEDFLYSLPNIIYRLKLLSEKMKLLFTELEKIYFNSAYNHRIGRYNSIENNFSFENELTENFKNNIKLFNNIQKEIDSEKLKNKIFG